MKRRKHQRLSHDHTYRRSRRDLNACELLTSAGSELTELLDDLPRVSPAEAEYVPASEAIPNYRQLKEAGERAE